jgi:hypothetical protein
MHEIALKTQEPIYVKQFKIPDAHRKEVEDHVLEWLKLGVIQPARSRYNSPIFAVLKKDGNVHLVQDFRALNTQSYTDKYSMKDASECIGEIGRSGNTIFTTIDLTAGFWQTILHSCARPYTAFTVPGMGQFQWATSPMGLVGCPASFQRLMETVVNSISNVIVYIDDLLVHSASHEDHLVTLNQVLERLVHHNIKINLQKCVLGSKEVSYLGFRLTEEGIKPGTDKLKAVKNAPPHPLQCAQSQAISRVVQLLLKPCLKLCTNYIFTHSTNKNRVFLERKATAPRSSQGFPRAADLSVQRANSGLS